MGMQAPLPPVRTAFFEPDPQNQGSSRIAWAWIQWFLQVESARTQFKNSYLQDTHANRLANYPAANYPSATEFFESDRHVFYIDNGTAWLYQSGVMLAPAANRPIDLGANDTGFAFIATDTGLISTWNGIAWINPTAALPAIVDALTFILQLARGTKAALPVSLPIGEPYFATDTNELYFGTGVGTHKVESDANSIQGVPVSSQVPVAGQLLIATPAGWVPGDPSVSGMAADGAAPLANPVRVAGTGTDGLVHTLQTDNQGILPGDSLQTRLLQQLVVRMEALIWAVYALSQPKGTVQDLDHIIDRALSDGDQRISA